MNGVIQDQPMNLFNLPRVIFFTRIPRQLEGSDFLGSSVL